MKVNSDKSYRWWKEKIECEGFYKVKETTEKIIVETSDACITFNKRDMKYTASGFGGELSFTTYPIYDDWKALITAWLNEHRKNAWTEEERT